MVTDESGALVPGAKVTVSNAAGPVKSGTAGDDGSYSINGVPPGKYTVQATSPGLQQAQPLAVDLSGVAQRHGQFAIAGRRRKAGSDGAGKRRTRQLAWTLPKTRAPWCCAEPICKRLSDDPDDLQADLQALAGPSAGPSGGQIYIDGFTGGTLPSKDSIREIRINQNPFSPEYDKLGYGRIEILTKPGTDKLHGNVNADFGDAIFDARNPYAAAEGAVPAAEFRRVSQRRAGQEGVLLSGCSGSRHRQRKHHQRLPAKPHHPSAGAFQQRLLSSAESLSNQPAHRLSAQQEQYADRALRLHA